MSRSIPYDFILDFFPESKIQIKKTFGHHCIYFSGKMVMFLIDKEGEEDSGVCLATEQLHFQSLCQELKSLRHLRAYGSEESDWLLIPADSQRFEEDVELACQMIKKRDPRIGREPKGKRKRARNAEAN